MRRITILVAALLVPATLMAQFNEAWVNVPANSEKTYDNLCDRMSNTTQPILARRCGLPRLRGQIVPTSRPLPPLWKLFAERVPILREG